MRILVGVGVDKPIFHVTLIYAYLCKVFSHLLRCGCHKASIKNMFSYLFLCHYQYSFTPQGEPSSAQTFLSNNSLNVSELSHT